MDNEDLIKKARNRVEQCRRLAGMMTDTRTQAVLNQMADEIEADIQTFETRERDGREA